ncbi:MAG: hypothetical protein GXP49_07625 [Deltaproteobacteria bacterium]|nr:hypothetical protein [Deltaproteobacteria bacterium]
MVITKSRDYKFIDCGENSRLEQFGDFLVERPASQAFWPKNRECAKWDMKKAYFKRTDSKGGKWLGSGLPESFTIGIGTVELLLKLKPTSFGHLGFFPEHLPQADIMKKIAVDKDRKNMNMLNLFGYTGAISLASAITGWQVTHLDASRSTVQWAKENAKLNHIESIRWITDDSLKFVKREIRRKKRYEAVIMDPPSFGRGSQGQVFKLEKDLPGLVENCISLLSGDACLFAVTSHTPGVTGSALANLLIPLAVKRGGLIEAGENLLAATESQNVLPCGHYARWVSGGKPAG